MPGPAPKPADQRRRRNAAPGSVVLPAEGRVGECPSWPLRVDEPSCWASLWELPQAVAWERLRMERVVARYASVLNAAEAEDASAAVLGEVRQLEDRLGLSPMAMLRLRWEVAEQEKSSATAGTVTSLADYRDL